MVRLNGVIRGSRIELEQETGLPDGARVSVQIEHRPVALEAVRRAVDELCGAWAQDDSLEAIFREIHER